MYNQQGQHGHGQHSQQGGNLRQNRYGGKSTSAESVLTVNGQRGGGSGQAGHGQQAHSTSKNYDQYGNNPNSASSSTGMKSSNQGANGSDQSSSPQSSNSESQLTPPEDHRSADQRSNGGNGNSNRVGIPQGPMRR